MSLLSNLCPPFKQCTTDDVCSFFLKLQRLCLVLEEIPTLFPLFQVLQHHSSSSFERKTMLSINSCITRVGCHGFVYCCICLSKCVLISNFVCSLQPFRTSNCSDLAHTTPTRFSVQVHVDDADKRAHLSYLPPLLKSQNPDKLQWPTRHWLKTHNACPKLN